MMWAFFFCIALVHYSSAYAIPVAQHPTPVISWDFAAGDDAYLDFHNATVVVGEGLVLNEPNACAFTTPGALGTGIIDEKSFAATLTVSNGLMRGGAPMSLEQRGVTNAHYKYFHALVYNEDKLRTWPGCRDWQFGSANFELETRMPDGRMVTTSPGHMEVDHTRVHLVLTYQRVGARVVMTLYRNGRVYLSREVHRYRSFEAELSFVMLGVRHTITTSIDDLPIGQASYLGGVIHSAALFDTALSHAEVEALFRKEFTEDLPVPRALIARAIEPRPEGKQYHGRSGPMAADVYGNVYAVTWSTVPLEYPYKDYGYKKHDGTSVSKLSPCGDAIWHTSGFPGGLGGGAINFPERAHAIVHFAGSVYLFGVSRDEWSVTVDDREVHLVAGTAFPFVVRLDAVTGEITAVKQYELEIVTLPGRVVEDILPVTAYAMNRSLVVACTAMHRGINHPSACVWSVDFQLSTEQPKLLWVNGDRPGGVVFARAIDRDRVLIGTRHQPNIASLLLVHHNAPAAQGSISIIDLLQCTAAGSHYVSLGPCEPLKFGAGSNIVCGITAQTGAKLQCSGTLSLPPGIEEGVHVMHLDMDENKLHSLIRLAECPNEGNFVHLAQIKANPMTDRALHPGGYELAISGHVRGDVAFPAKEAGRSPLVQAHNQMTYAGKLDCNIGVEKCTLRWARRIEGMRWPYALETPRNGQHLVLAGDVVTALSGEPELSSPVLHILVDDTEPGLPEPAVPGERDTALPDGVFYGDNRFLIMTVCTLAAIFAGFVVFCARCLQTIARRAIGGEAVSALSNSVAHDPAALDAADNSTSVADTVDTPAAAPSREGLLDDTDTGSKDSATVKPVVDATDKGEGALEDFVALDDEHEVRESHAPYPYAIHNSIMVTVHFSGDEKQYTAEPSEFISVIFYQACLDWQIFQPRNFWFVDADGRQVLLDIPWEAEPRRVVYLERRTQVEISSMCTSATRMKEVTDESSFVALLAPRPDDVKYVTVAHGIDLEQRRVGSFGQVIKGQWGRKVAETVALKFPHDNPHAEELLDHEIGVMERLSNDHVVRVYGRYCGHMVMEWMDQGDLHSFLRTTRMAGCIPGGDRSNLTVFLIEAAMSVAKGLAYLASENIVHNDVSARNVMMSAKVDGTYAFKVGDLGLSQRLPTGATNKQVENVQCAVAWAAPEVLCHGLLSERSDVWSFGMLLWEMFSGGEMPYSDWHDVWDGDAGRIYEDVLRSYLSQEHGIGRGRRLSCDVSFCDMPAGVRRLIGLCWRTRIEDRPTFARLYDELASELELAKVNSSLHAVCLSRCEETERAVAEQTRLTKEMELAESRHASQLAQMGEKHYATIARLHSEHATAIFEARLELLGIVAVGVAVAIVCMSLVIGCMVGVHMTYPGFHAVVYERIVPYSAVQDRVWARSLNFLAASIGYSPAQAYVALLAYDDGEIENAMNWAESALGSGNPTAQAVAAACMAESAGNGENITQALAIASMAASHGSALGHAIYLRIALRLGDSIPEANVTTVPLYVDDMGRNVGFAESDPGYARAQGYNALYAYVHGDGRGALFWGRRAAEQGNVIGEGVLAMALCDAGAFDDALTFSKRAADQGNSFGYIAALRCVVEGGMPLRNGRDVLQKFLARGEYDAEEVGSVLLQLALRHDPSKHRHDRKSWSRNLRNLHWQWAMAYLRQAAEVFGSEPAVQLLQRWMEDDDLPCFSCATAGVSGHVLSLACNDYDDDRLVPILRNQIETPLLPPIMDSDAVTETGQLYSPISCINVQGEGVFRFVKDTNKTFVPSISWLNPKGLPLLQRGLEAVGWSMRHFSMEVWAKPYQEISFCSKPARSCGMLLFPSHADGEHSGLGVSVGTNGVCVQGHYDNDMPCYARYNGKLDDWTHIFVVVSDGNSVSLYINGALQDTRAVERKGLLLPCRLNVWENSYGQFVGQAAAVNIWDRSLAGSEVQQRYLQATTIIDE